MRRPIKLEREGLEKEVEEREKRVEGKREMERIWAVKMAMGGKHPIGVIAEEVGKSRSTVAEWIRVVREEGLEELMGKHQGRGRKPRVEGKALRELKQGLARGRWKRAVEAQSWLGERFGIELTLTGTRYWLKKAGES